ncbi:MAG: hypothetical protein HC935_10905 [Pseudanabaena sp. SU_2_4]|nr:hypothetical protein [Pseudanabaena sp. SU_2_4]
MTPESCRRRHPKTELYDLLFSPSFSTAEKVSELSGRGMGLSAVRSQIVSLKGNITINSEVGSGNYFHYSPPTDPHNCQAPDI